MHNLRRTAFALMLALPAAAQLPELYFNAKVTQNFVSLNNNQPADPTLGHVMTMGGTVGVNLPSPLNTFHVEDGLAIDSIVTPTSPTKHLVARINGGSFLEVFIVTSPTPTYAVCPARSLLAHVNAKPSSVRFSPDGKYIYALIGSKGTQDEILRRYDLDSSGCPVATPSDFAIAPGQTSSGNVYLTYLDVVQAPTKTLAVVGGFASDIWLIDITTTSPVKLCNGNPVKFVGNQTGNLPYTRNSPRFHPSGSHALVLSHDAGAERGALGKMTWDPLTFNNCSIAEQQQPSDLDHGFPNMLTTGVFNQDGTLFYFATSPPQKAIFVTDGHGKGPSNNSGKAYFWDWTGASVSPYDVATSGTYVYVSGWNDTQRGRIRRYNIAANINTLSSSSYSTFVESDTSAIMSPDPAEYQSRFLTIPRLVRDPACFDVPTAWNLTAWWPLPPTGNTAADVTPNLNNGTATALTSVIDYRGDPSGASRFNGTSSFIDVPTSNSLNPDTGNFSIDLWMKIASSADNLGTRTLLEKRLSASTGPGYLLFLANNRPGLQLYDPNGWSNYELPNAFPTDDKWHLLAVTVDRVKTDGVVFYIDGVKQGTTGNPTNRPGSLSSAAHLRIGRAPGVFQDVFFKGDLDEIEFFKTALTAEQVALLYQRPKCLTQCNFPELQITSVQATPTNSVVLGNNVTYSVTVKNNSLVPSPSVPVYIYLTTGPNCTGDFYLQGTIAVPALGANGGPVTLTGTFMAIAPLPSPPAAKPYFLCARLRMAADCDFTNNSASGPAPLTIQPSTCTISGTAVKAPDFTTVSVTLFTTSTVWPGGTLQLEAVIANIGSADYGPTGNAKITVWLSSDAVFDPNNDIFAGTLQPNSLLVPPTFYASNTKTFLGHVLVPSGTPAGQYYVFVFADGKKSVLECNEDNNTLAAAAKAQVGGKIYDPGPWDGGPYSGNIPAVNTPTLVSGPSAIVYRKAARDRQTRITLTLDDPAVSVFLYAKRGSPPTGDRDLDLPSGGDAGRAAGEVRAAESIDLDVAVEADFRDTSSNSTKSIVIPPGDGTYYIALGVNTVGVSTRFTLRATDEDATVSSTQLISQIADGAGWKTSITLVNLDTQPAPFTLRFYQANGSALPLGFRGITGKVALLQGTIPVGGSRTYETLGTDDALSQGWGNLITAQKVGGQAVFRQSVSGRPDQEAAVSVTRPAPRFFLPFNNQGFTTAMALVNSHATAGGRIAGTIRGENGQGIAGNGIDLLNLGHSAFALTDRFPQTAGIRGAMEFQTSSGEHAALGLRFGGSSFTSFAALVPPAQKAATQFLSQIADGDLWQTQIVLVNLDSVPASYTLNFYKDDGSLLPLGFQGETGTLSSLIGTLPVGGSRIITTTGIPTARLSQGWAELLTSQKIDGLGVFKQSLPGQAPQEAAVGITSGTQSFAMPFDNTQGFVTAMAIMNGGGSQAVTVNVVLRDEDGNVIARPTLRLGAREHQAFALSTQFSQTANRRGVAEFTVTESGITGLGLRFNPSGAFTSFQVFPK